MPVEELELPNLRDKQQNLHHMAYYARSFGRFAISETFRNLTSQQVYMPIRQHDELHRRYSGIELPPIVNMLDRIEQAYEEGEQLRVRYVGGYVLHNLNAVHLQTLKYEYNDIKRI